MSPTFLSPSERGVTLDHQSDGDAAGSVTSSPPVIRDGDQTDVESVYRAYAGDVTRWVARLAGPDCSDVEDIVHDVFVVVQRRLSEFRGEAKLSTWLYGIVLRLVRSRRRRRKWLGWLPGQVVLHSPPPGSPGETKQVAPQVATEVLTALELMERRETTSTVYSILEKLPEKYRTVLILFELEGLSGEEIASITGTTISNVWVRLFRGREKVLRTFQDLEARGIR